MRLPILLSCALTLAVATDQANADTNWIQRVRASPELLEVIHYGITRSPTFGTLIDRINQSDLILYVEWTLGPAHATGATNFLGRAGDHRYALITLRGAPGLKALVALLGHELRHAVELADSPAVLDSSAYEALYRRIGRSRCGPPRWCFETSEAFVAGRKVRAELTNADSTR